MKVTTLAAAASLLLFGSAFAAQKTQVEPGSGPTESVTKAVPTMKTDCPDQTAGNKVTPGTGPTESTGAAVPAMKPGDIVCPDRKVTKR